MYTVYTYVCVVLASPIITLTSLKQTQRVCFTRPLKRTQRVCFTRLLKRTQRVCFTRPLKRTQRVCFTRLLKRTQCVCLSGPLKHSVYASPDSVYALPEWAAYKSTPREGSNIKQDQKNKQTKRKLDSPCLTASFRSLLSKIYSYTRPDKTEQTKWTRNQTLVTSILFVACRPK
jgi:hypothetical protein